MTLTETLDTYFTTFAEGRDHISYIARVSDDGWEVQADDELLIMATLDEAGGRLGLTAILGTAPEDRRLAVCEALLSYSTLWRSTGGVRGAMAGGGLALLIVELTLADLSESGLHRTLDNFGVKARFFRDFVTAGTDSAAAPDTSGFIRI